MAAIVRCRSNGRDKPTRSTPTAANKPIDVSDRHVLEFYDGIGFGKLSSIQDKHYLNTPAELLDKLRHVPRPPLSESCVWEIKGDPADEVIRYGAPKDLFIFSMMRLVAFVDAIWVPFLLSFAEVATIRNLCLSPIALLLDILMNLCYGAGTLLQLRTSAVDLNLATEYVDPKEILLYRISSISFCFDSLSVLGIFWPCPGMKLIACLRLFRVWRLSSTADDVYEIQSATLSTEKPFVAFCKLLVSIAAVIHLFACMWFLAMTLGSEDDYEHELMTDPRYLGGSILSIYLVYFADGAAMLVGWGGPPAYSANGIYTQSELVVWSILAPTAALYNAFVLTQLLDVVEQASAATEKHLERLSQVSNFMEPLRVPDILKRRFMQCTAFLSVHNVNKRGESEIMDSTSKDMMSEIKLWMFEDLIATAAFFQEIPANFVVEVVCAFEVVVFSPGDMIFSKGDPGEALFFILYGKAMVLDNNCDIICYKNVGEYFGEVALVYDKPRNASVATDTYCILAKLSREVFNNVLQKDVHIKNRIIDQIIGPAIISVTRFSDARENDAVIEGPSSRKYDSEITPLLSGRDDGENAQVEELQRLASTQLVELKSSRAERIPTTPLATTPLSPNRRSSGDDRDRAFDESLANSLRLLSEEVNCIRRNTAALETRFGRVEARLATYPF